MNKSQLFDYKLLMQRLDVIDIAIAFNSNLKSQNNH